MLADLVEQQTTTTGTGSYTVSGSVSGRRTFASALADLNTVPYVCTDDAGNFECGFGTWTASGGTISRNAVTASSNAGAAVNWAAGTKRIYISPIAGSLPINTASKHNVGYSLPPPGVNDDNTLGYSVGSQWVNESNGRIYTCISPAAGAARWSLAPIKLNNATFNTYYIDGGTQGTNVWAHYSRSGHTYSGGLVSDGSTFWDYADGAVFALMAKTTDATVRTMALNDNFAANNAIYCEGKSTATIIGTVQAIDGATGDTKVWKIEAIAKTNGSFATTIALGATPTSIYNDAGAAAWSIAVVGGSSEMSIQVTGAAAKTIIWGASLQLGVAAHNV